MNRKYHANKLICVQDFIAFFLGDPFADGFADTGFVPEALVVVEFDKFKVF